MCWHRGPRSQWFWAVEARNWRCCRVAAVPSPIWFWRLTFQAENCPHGRNLSTCWKERQSSETQIWPIRCRCTPCAVHRRPWTCMMSPIARTLRAILRRWFPLPISVLIFLKRTDVEHCAHGETLIWSRSDTNSFDASASCTRCRWYGRLAWILVAKSLTIFQLCVILRVDFFGSSRTWAAAVSVALFSDPISKWSCRNSTSRMALVGNAWRERVLVLMWRIPADVLSIFVWEDWRWCCSRELRYNCKAHHSDLRLCDTFTIFFLCKGEGVCCAFGSGFLNLISTTKPLLRRLVKSRSR